jgi:hypothetical protein
MNATIETTETTIYEIHDSQGSYEKQFRIATPEALELALIQAEATPQAALGGAVRLMSRDELIAKMATGREIIFGETANYYYTHDNKRIRIQPAPRPAPVMVACSCGHTVESISVMSTSTGSSCPDCYDRMSE